MREREPEVIIRRARLWEEVFNALDEKRTFDAMVDREVKGGYVVSLPWEGLEGFLNARGGAYSGGDVVNVRISMADYVTKEIRVKPSQGIDIQASLERLREAASAKQAVRARVRGAVNGGLLLDIDGVKAFLPAGRIEAGEETRDSLREYVGEEFDVLLLKVSRKSTIATRMELLQRGKERQADNQKGKH